MGKLHYFNANNHPSDTDGDLKGNVFYAQSSIIPARNHIDGDIHPNLVSARKTLVIFKPHEEIKYSSSIELKIYTRSDEEIYSTELLSPQMLPRIAGSEFNFTNLTLDDYSIPDTFDFHSNSPEKTNQLANNPASLSEVLNNNKTIKLDIQDINSPFQVSLDNISKHPHRKIVFNIIDNVTVKIQYKNKFFTLPTHQSFVMISDDEGNWFSRNESRLSQHYKQILDSYKRNLVPTSFNVTVETNESIKKLAKDTSYFNELLSKNNSLKISTGDGYWAKNFNLPNEKKICK
ncbi:hypothetical protein RZ760_007650 [Providencia rettgeri]|nr:hypothetical protein [Providencia rettgeri]